MQLFGPFYAFFLFPISGIVFPAWFVFAGQDSDALGIFLGTQALGGMIGGFAFAAVAPKVSQHKWLVGATAAYALALLSLYFLQPGSALVVAVGFLAGLVFTGIVAIPYTAFYTRTPEALLGRVNSLGTASAYLVGALAALCFGWLVTTTSARVGILASAIGLGLLAIAALWLPFMKLLDEKQAPELTVPLAKNEGVPVAQSAD